MVAPNEPESSLADRETGVRGYLSRLARRAALLHGLRFVLALSGAAGLVFGIAALLLGPLGDPSLAWLAWAAVVSVGAVIAYVAWRAYAPLRGGGITTLLVQVRPRLASEARSAYEMEFSPPSQVSESLVRAHSVRVGARLATTRPRDVINARWLGSRPVLVSLVGLLLTAVLLSTERGAAGAYTLVHPGERTQNGERVAVVFGHVEARLVFPSYRDRAPATLSNPSTLQVPRGTSIEIRGRTQLSVRRATLEVGERTIPMAPTGDGRLVGRFVAREDANLSFRVQGLTGAWIQDATSRVIEVEPDAPPQVSLLAPSNDVMLDDPEEVVVRWDAVDDVGLARVDLVVRGPEGDEHRRRVVSYDEGQRPERRSGQTRVDPASVSLRAGDSLTFWLEARDGDVVSGPNIGRSEERTLTLASPTTRRERQLADLSGVLDATLGLLADRLERPVPEDLAESRSRHEALRTPTDLTVRRMRAYAETLRTGTGRASDVALFEAMARRVRRQYASEGAEHQRSRSRPERRRGVNAENIEELEDDALTLDDLFARAQVDDAAEIARELESLRREIHSLLAEVRRTESPDARRRLMSAIARAQRQMRELMRRISQMGTSVPEEFVNRGELPTQESADSLAALREAVERGNLDRADQLVGELAHDIDQLAQALNSAGEEFAEARFGPRERAMANAMESLRAIEQEQGELAAHALARRSRAAERALEAMGGSNNRIGQRLASQAQRIRQTLDGVDRDRLATFEQDTYDRARQRMTDTIDALASGDLGEARRMSEAAAQDLSALSRDLDLSALMFPGHEGQVSQGARAAREADRGLRDLRRDLDEALPDVGSRLTPRERQQMQSESGRQRRAQGATDGLAEQFDQGPDGTPLSPDAARSLEDISRMMRSAADALSERDPLESAQSAESAARRLSDLRRRLEQQQQSRGSGAGGSGMQNDPRRQVRIPDPDQFVGPMEQRRRVLDAMQEVPAAGYEEALRQYYEGLLR